MSVDIIFTDRVPTYANRYLLNPESGNASYVTLERADDPSVPGTPLNADTLNRLVSQINNMETEVKAYADTKVAETVVIAQYASAKGSAESLALPQGDITPLALDTWGTKSGDNFTFSEGGMVMPTSGVVLVFGAVYFNTSTPANPEQLGVYICKNGEEVSGQLTYSISSTGIHMAPVTLEVEEGDILTLCARNTTKDGSCIPNSRHTALTVYYLTGGGSVVSGDNGDHSDCVKSINGMFPGADGNIFIEFGSGSVITPPSLDGAVYVLANTTQNLSDYFKANARNNIGAVASVNGRTPDANGNVDLTTLIPPTVESGGGVTDEQIAAAVAAYFAEHPAVRVAEIELISANWVGDASPYSQIVNIPGITQYSQVDLTPSVEQLAIFHDKDLAFVTENEDGVVTVYAIGDKPLNDYIMQVTIKEVSV